MVQMIDFVVTFFVLMIITIQFFDGTRFLLINKRYRSEIITIESELFPKILRLNSTAHTSDRPKWKHLWFTGERQTHTLCCYIIGCTNRSLASSIIHWYSATILRCYCRLNTHWILFEFEMSRVCACNGEWEYSTSIVYVWIWFTWKWQSDRWRCRRFEDSMEKIPCL